VFTCLKTTGAAALSAVNMALFFIYSSLRNPSTVHSQVNIDISPLLFAKKSVNSLLLTGFSASVCTEQTNRLFSGEN